MAPVQLGIDTSMGIRGGQAGVRHAGPRAILQAALALLFPAALAAQTLAMRHFDSRDGLPQSQVSSLLEDRHGFIWASTGDGLVRMGPNESQVYDGTRGFRAKDINELVEDADGTIWAATEETGLSRIRGREVAVFGPAQGLLDVNVHCLALTRKGELFAGTQQGLFRRRGERFEHVPLPAPWLAAAITGVAEDAGGGLWVGSRQGALARWDGAVLTTAVLPVAARSGNILKLRTDALGRTWALQAERLLRLDGLAGQGTWSVAALPGLPASVVLTGVSFDRKGALLLALGTDGVYLQEPGGAGRHLTPRELPCRDAINCALRDRNGGLWLGTDGDHLWAQPTTGLHSLVRDPDTGAELGLGSVTSFVAQPGGRMLLGSNNGVFLWAPGKGILKHWNRANGLAGQEVWALRGDAQGGAWIGTTKGLFRLAPDGGIRPGPRELAQVQSECVLGQGGRLWVGTDKGLAELDGQGRFLAMHDPVGQVGYSSAHCLAVQDGTLLVGSSQGLLRFRDGHFERAFPSDPTQGLQVLSLELDARQRLWVGTSQGLQVLDLKTGAWSNLGLEANGRPLYSITWIRCLANGAVAIGHAKGVTLVSPAGRTFQLTRRMGLVSDETNQGAALEDASGRLWIGMVGGVCLLDGAQGLPELQAPTPVILDVAWPEGSFWLPGRVTLPRGCSSLSLHVDAGSPNTPFPVRYEMRFEAPAAPWHALEPGRGSIFFEGLSQGTHRVRFRVSLNGRDWRESPAVDLTIQPAWYQTFWARGAMALLIALGGVSAFRLRLHHLRQRNEDLENWVHQRTRELEGSAQELARKNQSLEWTHRQLKDTLESRMALINTVSHDLRSPLTSILLSVEQIQASAEEVSPRLQKTYGIMAQEARRLDAIVKGLLDRNRAESLTDRLTLEPAHPGAILDRLEDTLVLKGEARGLRTHLSIEPASLEAEVLLDLTAMQQVLFNLVENALKFTDPPGDVGVRSTLEAGHWVLEIWDTGRGIPKEECDRLFNPFEQAQAKDARKGWGLGLFICRSIVAAHGGTIGVDSDRGKGSIFRVAIPLPPVAAAEG